MSARKRERCAVGSHSGDWCGRTAAWFVETVTGDYWVCERCCVEYSLEDCRNLKEEPS